MKLPPFDWSIFHWKTVRQAILVFFAVAISLVVLFHMPLIRVASSDLWLYFRPATRAWLSGGAPYEVYGYVNPPWTLPLLVPFSLGPPRLGYVLLFLFSCAVLAGAVRAFGGGAWMLFGVLIAPPTVALLALGQIDAWVLLGVLLGRRAVDRKRWPALGVALAFVLTKPQTGGLVALLWMLTLPRSLTGPALALMGVTWFLTCLSVGVWWPFGSHLAWHGVSLGKSISTLHLVQGLGLPPFLYPVIVICLFGLWAWEVWRRRLSDYTLALSLLVGALSSPYVLRHSLSLCLATALVLVRKRAWPWAFLCYLLTWTPLLTLWTEHWQRWWEVGAWWLLLAGLLFVGRQSMEE
jgi:hypothetical protein